MSDELMNTPQEEQETEIFGLSESTDGKRNSYTLSCKSLGQSMNYAACLWRQQVLEKRDIKTPADWSGCDAAGRAGTCTAMQMREEEMIAGRSIYFRSRETVIKAMKTAREWIMPSFGGSKSAPAPRPAAPSAPKPAHVLDAVSSPSYADALELMARGEAEKARVERVIPIVPVAAAPSTPIASMVALPGESPLAMARRLRAQQSTNP